MYLVSILSNPILQVSIIPSRSIAVLRNSFYVKAFQCILNLYLLPSWLQFFMIHPSHKTHDVLLFIIVSRNKKNNANCMTHQNSGWKGSSCTWALLITLIVHAKLKIVYYGTRLKRKSWSVTCWEKQKLYTLIDFPPQYDINRVWEFIISSNIKRLISTIHIIMDDVNDEVQNRYEMG